MDFLKRQGIRRGIRIMEVGSGWGLVGIYCAKTYGASVTCVDIDSEVFPYLRLHALTNSVEITTMTRGFDELTDGELQGFDVVIGSDICFWNDMSHSLKRLILRALRADVRLVLIADPGRSPFEQLGVYFAKSFNGKMVRWAITHPYPIQGRILKLGSLIYQGT
jgi:predicted nicotinamide N-methyase